jgi:hypothetical protein
MASETVTMIQAIIITYQDIVTVQIKISRFIFKQLSFLSHYNASQAVITAQAKK